MPFTVIPRTLATIFILFSIVAGPSLANWPDRPITMIIMSREGGGMDRASRLLGEALSMRLDTPIKFVNRPGASGSIALMTFLEADVDGYTVFSGNIPTISMMHGQEAPDYDLEEKLTWLGAYLIDPALLLMAPSADMQSIDQFIETTKGSTARIGVANWNSVQTLALLQLQDETSASFEIIPYSGFRGAAIDLLGQHIEAAVGNFSAAERLKENHDVKYLGIFADKMPNDADVSPIAEVLEINVIEAASIRALGVHADLKEAFPDRYDTLDTAFADVIGDQAFIDKFSSIGADPSQAIAWCTDEAHAAVEEIAALYNKYQDLFE